MDLAVAASAAVVAAVLGIAAAHWQHLLFRDPEHRVRGQGVAYFARLGFVAIACGVTTGLAFRPDHYDLLPAALTAVFCFVLAVLSSADFERRLLPNRLMYPALLAAVLFSWAWPDRSAVDIAIGGAVAAGAAVGLFALGVLFGNARGSGLGFGDVKLLVLLGLLAGWPAVGPAVVIGILLGGIPALALILTGRRNVHFSYGPYLSAGGAIVLLFPGNFV